MEVVIVVFFSSMFACLLVCPSLLSFVRLVGRRFGTFEMACALSLSLLSIGMRYALFELGTAPCDGAQTPREYPAA
jgi:hypothetical protein